MGPDEQRPLDSLESRVADLRSRGLLNSFSVVSAGANFEDLVRAVRAQPPGAHGGGDERRRQADRHHSNGERFTVRSSPTCTPGW